MSEQFNFLANNAALDKLLYVFHQQFERLYNTRLVGGGAEPLYRPGVEGRPCEIVFTRDYFSSAMHEVAHWCIAGKERRQRVDYGYWYRPDGRTAAQQRKFEQVEVKPQALERIFSFASGHTFRVSADNLHGDVGASTEFVDAVHRQTIAYCEAGLPERAKSFALGLAMAFECPDPMCIENYRAEELNL